MCKFPKYKCEFCGDFIQLKFSPLRDSKKLDNWRCPHCGHRRPKQNYEEFFSAKNKKDIKISKVSSV